MEEKFYNLSERDILAGLQKTHGIGSGNRLTLVRARVLKDLPLNSGKILIKGKTYVFWAICRVKSRQFENLTDLLIMPLKYEQKRFFSGLTNVYPMSRGDFDQIKPAFSLKIGETPDMETPYRLIIDGQGFQQLIPDARLDAGHILRYFQELDQGRYNGTYVVTPRLILQTDLVNPDFMPVFYKADFVWRIAATSDKRVFFRYQALADEQMFIPDTYRFCSITIGHNQEAVHWLGADIRYQRRKLEIKFDGWHFNSIGLSRY